jgi:hypothetical protein
MTGNWPMLRTFPAPAKILVTAVLLTMTIGLVGALGQIIVHDVIPIFYQDSPAGHSTHHAPPAERGDLLSELSTGPSTEPMIPFYKSEQFVWTLRWTHIHLFGMNLIFIIVGMVTSFLNLSTSARSWLIALPFLGVQVDIASMWLKGYVSENFFWLHLPGGGLFTVIFIYVFSRAFREMWLLEKPGVRT